MRLKKYLFIFVFLKDLVWLYCSICYAEIMWCYRRVITLSKLAASSRSQIVKYRRLVTALCDSYRRTGYLLVTVCAVLVFQVTSA